MMVSKVLIISGPTATGKTKFGLEIAKQFDGEIVSADSRQVYIGKNIIHGKDLPVTVNCQSSIVNWRGRRLKYYVVDGVRVWLYDVVNPGEDFSVAFWKECADLVIADIVSRNKLPIIVGGSGLYIKSLTQNLSQVSVPRNEKLRDQLLNKSVKYLFNYLNRIDSFRAAALNHSDKNNPRRLVRAIELSLSKEKLHPSPELKRGLSAGMAGVGGEVLQIGLIAPRDYLYQLVNHRVSDRIAAGAAAEDANLANSPVLWQNQEHAIIRHQLTWFKKQPNVTFFDVSAPNWQANATTFIKNWYNNST